MKTIWSLLSFLRVCHRLSLRRLRLISKACEIIAELLALLRSEGLHEAGGSSKRDSFVFHGIDTPYVLILAIRFARCGFTPRSRRR